MDKEIETLITILEGQELHHSAQIVRTLQQQNKQLLEEAHAECGECIIRDVRIEELERQNKQLVEAVGGLLSLMNRTGYLKLTEEHMNATHLLLSIEGESHDS